MAHRVPRVVPEKALVVGYGVSGRAAADWLVGQGCEVVVLEDDRAAGEAARVEAAGAGLTLEVAPGPAGAAELARSSGLVVPSPGVRADHPAVAGAIAAGVEVLSEIELAWRVLADLRPDGLGEVTWPKLVAITGTNGKTTVTELVAAMLVASGRDAVAAGNVGYPLIEAARHLVPGQATVLVAEISSFQLEFTREFRPDVSCWLNFAPTTSTGTRTSTSTPRPRRRYGPGSEPVRRSLSMPMTRWSGERHWACRLESLSLVLVLRPERLLITILNQPILAPSGTGSLARTA